MFGVFVILFFVSSVFAETGSRAPLVLSEEDSIRRDILLDWADQRTSIIIDQTPSAEDPFYPTYVDIPSKPLHNVDRETSEMATKTSLLYFRLFGRNTLASLVWTGIETANPLTADEKFRWNSLRDSGFYSAEVRRKFIDRMEELGIKNLRMGISNDEIDLSKPETWKPFDEMMADLSASGMGISLDLHHFGIEDRFRVADSNNQLIHHKSYYLHDEWPDYFARYSLEAVKRYQYQIKAITLMNEAETVIGFNAHFWHGGYPGFGSYGELKWYIGRALQVAIAGVKARVAIEKHLASLPEALRPEYIYMHTQAGVYKPYWPEFNIYRRFVIDDLFFGHEWLMSANLEALAQVPIETLRTRWSSTPESQRTNLDWVIENYIFYQQPAEQAEETRAYLLAKLRTLREAHDSLKQFDKTMKSDTVYALDYYAHNEDQSADGRHLGPEPYLYGPQMLEGHRSGLYSLLIDYFNRYQMPMMIGESGTPFYVFGSRWSQQMLLECARVAEQGVPFLGYTIYPAIDTYGWEHALSRPKEGSLLNPSGLVTHDMEIRPFARTLVESIQKFSRETESRRAAARRSRK